MNAQKMDQEKKKLKFEKLTSIFGLTNTQFLALRHFDKFYESRKNQGLEQIEKNQDLMLAKTLFSCWDTKRMG